jgi:hypothetical protein
MVSALIQSFCHEWDVVNAFSDGGVRPELSTEVLRLLNQFVCDIIDSVCVFVDGGLTCSELSRSGDIAHSVRCKHIHHG